MAEAQGAFGIDEIRIAFGEGPRRSTRRSRVSDCGDAGQAAAQEGQSAFRCRPAGNVRLRQDQRQKTEKVDLGRLAIGPLATNIEAPERHREIVVTNLRAMPRLDEHRRARGREIQTQHGRLRPKQPGLAGVDEFPAIPFPQQRVEERA
ncbi:hypothetical protein [Mesorhizobium sp. LSJC264A00]|uniref:hypothetical protein n=1 Tax=Mesorhizobium sp. LSJC264A00 TaxID=1287321 RepID=UPI001FDAACA9|nr:hypothetical protein [Mesorhizobium sp. LSJC264A00]